MRRQNHLGQDPIRGLVFRLAIPSMIAQLVNVLYSIIDRIYIGNIPVVGDTALAGAGVCGPIVTLLSSFGLLVGLGGSILMAMKMGEGDLPKARQILSNSFLMLVILSLVLTLLFLLSKEQLLWWFGASETTFSYADTYMTIYTAGTFFALMAMGLNYFITCQGFSMIGMVTVLIGAVCNIVLDPVFIFGFQMGVGGAGRRHRHLSICFLSLCPVFSGRQASTGSALLRRLFSEADAQNRFSRSVALFDHGNGQRYGHHHEHRITALWRSWPRRPAHHLRYHRPELFPSDLLADVRHHRRHAGDSQL